MLHSCCFLLAFVCPAPLTQWVWSGAHQHIHTLTRTRSFFPPPAGHWTGGAAVLICFQGHEGSECLFMIPVCVCSCWKKSFLLPSLTLSSMINFRVVFFFFFASSFTYLELFTGSRTVCAFAPKSKLHLFRLDVAGRRGKKYELPHEHAEFPTRQREQFALSWPLRAGRCMSGLALGKWKDLCGKSNHSEAMTQWEKGLLSACDSFTHRIISKTAASES